MTAASKKLTTVTTCAWARTALHPLPHHPRHPTTYDLTARRNVLPSPLHALRQPVFFIDLQGTACQDHTGCRCRRLDTAPTSPSLERKPARPTSRAPCDTSHTVSTRQACRRHEPFPLPCGERACGHAIGFAPLERPFARTRATSSREADAPHTWSGCSAPTPYLWTPSLSLTASSGFSRCLSERTAVSSSIASVVIGTSRGFSLVMRSVLCVIALCACVLVCSCACEDCLSSDTCSC